MAGYRFLITLIFLCFRLAKCSPIEDSCTVSEYSKVEAAAKSCSTLTIKNLVIPEKTTLNIDLKDGARLIFDGHLTHIPAYRSGDLIKITGKNVVITGTANHLLDGLGKKYWNGKKDPSKAKPKFIRLALQHSNVNNLHLKNCPMGCVMVKSSNTIISNILIDNRDGYPGNAGENFAINTDGFDVSSGSNVIVKDSTVYNQDDCVAVNGGTHLTFDNLHCNGSHGLSFSVFGDEVHDVQFTNSRVENANLAIHIKTHNAGTTGKLYNILYKNITFSAIDKFAVNVQENYPSGEAKANIPITNLTLEDIHGTMTGNNGIGINIICAKNGCEDWHWKNVKVSGAKKANVCENVPTGVSC